MKKILVALITAVTLMDLASMPSAHDWSGGWAPFAVGAVAGAVVANAYYRPDPVCYVPPSYYYPQQHAAAFCSEIGLYYPQSQACPSG